MTNCKIYIKHYKYDIYKVAKNHNFLKLFKNIKIWFIYILKVNLLFYNKKISSNLLYNKRKIYKL